MPNLENKRLLVLGGSIWKDAIKQFAEANRITIISAGLYPAGTDEIADEVYRIDTIDEQVMIPFIKEKKIDGVYLGGSELIISGACEYINKLGLPCYCNKEQWNSLMNKNIFKQLCVKFDLPIVDKYQINDTIEYPVVVKPTDSCGSSGLTIVTDKSQLDSALKRAEVSSREGGVLIEKFVNNQGYCVFYTFINGEAIFSGMEAKLPIFYENSKSYVGGLYYFTNKREKIFREKFEPQLKKLFSHIGLKAGSLWIEVFYDNGNFYFNEVGLRPGGEVSQYPVNYYTGINQVAQDIYYSLTGDSVLVEASPLAEKVDDKDYAIYPVHINAGTIKTFNVEKFKNNPDIIKVFMTKSEGDIVENSGTFSQICALVHFKYKEIADIETLIKLINTTLEIKDEKDKNMIIPKIYEPVNGYISPIYGRGGYKLDIDF